MDPVTLAVLGETESCTTVYACKSCRPVVLLKCIQRREVGMHRRGVLQGTKRKGLGREDVGDLGGLGLRDDKV